MFFRLILFILFLIVPFSVCSNSGLLSRSYDYWMSVAGEVADRKPIELLALLDLHPYFLSTVFKNANATDVHKYLRPELFKEASVSLTSYARNWESKLSSACVGDLKSMAKALYDLASATVVQCERLHNDAENLTKCLDNQRNDTQTNMWPMQMINAFGAPSPGLFHQGQYLWYGSYHQCRYTVVSGTKSQGAVYCMVSFGGSLEEIVQPSKDGDEIRLRLKWGVCLPAGCVEKDRGSKFLSNLIQSMTNLNRIVVESKILSVFERHNVYCQLQDAESALGGGQITVLIMFAALAALILVGTVVDFKSSKWAIRNEVQKKLSSIQLSKITDKEKDTKFSHDDVTSVVSLETPSAYSVSYLPTFDLESVVSYKSQASLKRCLKKLTWWMKILMAFSFRLNVRWLLQTNHHNCGNSHSEKSKRITCVFGIKSLTMIWVILGHTYIFALPHVSNLLYVSNALPRNALSQIVLNASLSVDTFFLISGLLTSYMFCVRMLSNPKKQRLDSVAKWSIFYAHRLFRLLPPYAAVLAFVSTWFSNLGGGPQWDPNHIYGVQCNNGDIWWRHLLFVNNLLAVDESSLCLPWMWHIAVDFQLYLVAPFFLVLLWKKPKWGVGVTGVVIVASAIGRGVVTAQHKLPTNLMLFLPNEHFNNDFRKYFELIYEKPYFRCGPYFVGILTGWCLAVHVEKLKSLRLNVCSKVLIWMLIAVFCSWPLFGIYPMYGYFYNNVYNALFAAINRTVWSIGVAMVIVTCHCGHNQWVNAVLSWTKFWPASRLTYSMYLTHELIIVYVLYTMTTPVAFDSHLSILAFFFLFLAFTYPVAFITFIAVEAPTMAAERLLFRKKSKRKLNKIPSVNSMVDRSLMAKRWADVVAKGAEQSPEGWGKNLYDSITIGHRLNLIDEAIDKCSSSDSDSDSDEVIIDPEIDFNGASAFCSLSKEDSEADDVDGIPNYPPPKLPFGADNSSSPSSTEKTPPSAIDFSAYHLLENSDKPSEVDQCVNASISSVVLDSVADKRSF